MSIVLRDYQLDLIDRTRHLMRGGVRTICIQGPTGMGKTALTAHMLKTASEKGLRAWFVVHRRELVKQSMNAFDKVGVHHGIVSSNFMEDHHAPVQICSIQTVKNRLFRMKEPQLIVWDEAHHCAAGSWQAIRKTFPSAFHIGITATPERLDGKGLKDYFDRLIEGPSVAWLIEHGYLSPYRMFAPPTAQAKFHVRMGDFIKSEIVEAMNKPTVTGSAIHEYQKICSGKRAVVFCSSIEHSRSVVEQFKHQGIPAEHVDGETDTAARDAAIERFKTGETKVLSNVDLFGEGFDLPAIECAILLRPTNSLGLYLQQVGRALRPSDGKTEAIILDHAGNCERHGLPDEERTWSLDGREIKKKGEKQLTVRVCPKCFGAQPSGKGFCQHCGHQFDVKERVLNEVDGELQEIDKSKIVAVRKEEQSKARTLQQLEELGRSRGYKRAALWARHVYMSRQRRG